jgi:hypothetical protein
MNPELTWNAARGQLEMPRRVACAFVIAQGFSGIAATLMKHQASPGWHRSSQCHCSRQTRSWHAHRGLQRSNSHSAVLDLCEHAPFPEVINRLDSAETLVGGTTGHFCNVMTLAWARN